MGVFTRRLIKQDLDKVDVFIEDSNNEYFIVQDIPDTFTQGRTTFKLFGSQFLKEDVPLKIEILDRAGNTVYVAPVDYGQGNNSLNLPFRYVSVEVYRPPINISGAATLVILGELSNNVPFIIPEQYKDTYNVRYTTKINIDSTEPINKSPILFYKKPKFTVQEIVKGQLVKKEIVTRTIKGTGVYGSAGKNHGDAYVIPTSSLKDTFEDQSSPATTKDDEITADIETFVNNPKFLTGEQKRPAFLGKKGSLENRTSPAPPEFKIIQHSFNPNFTGSFNSRMVGGEIRIPKESIYVNDVPSLFKDYRSTSVVRGLLSDFQNEYVSWNDYTGSIEKVVNGKIIHLKEPFHITFQPPAVTAQKQVVKASFGNPYRDNALANFTASYQDIAAPSTSSYRFDSFIDLDLTNLRTFSGDIYRIRVSGKSQTQQGDFPVMLDTVVESPELIIDSNSPSGVLRTGYFQSQAHADFYWEKSSNTSATYNNENLIDSIHISGSYSSTATGAGRFELKDVYGFNLLKGVPYTLTFNAYGKRTNKTKQDGTTSKMGRLFFHVSGSELRGDNDLNVDSSELFGQTITNEAGKKVGIDLDRLLPPDSDSFVNLGRISHTFLPNFRADTANKDSNAKIQIRVESGEWHISDISLRPASDTGFSPDTYSTRIPIPNNTLRPDRYDFLVEYFDVNNNAAKAYNLITDVPIVGAPLVLEGIDNMLTGSLFLGNIQGSGIELHGGSAFVRAVGYEGFVSASAGNGGGFFMWSGSVEPGGNTQNNYKGAGLEIHDGNTGVSESFLKFRTIDPDNNDHSTLEVQTSKFFLGQSDTQFVSGAQGNIEISSSNFHLTSTGDVTMSGDITANAGFIGNWEIVNGRLSGSNATLDANGAALFKSDQGPGSDTSATFDQLRDEYYIDFTPADQGNTTNYYVKFGPNFAVDSTGKLIASGAVFEGSITASAGLIGGFTTDDDAFFTGTKNLSTFMISGSASGTGQAKSNLIISSSGFTVNSQGQISASAGVIGGWNVEPTKLVSSDNKLRIEPDGEYIISASKFQVDRQGNMTASAGLIAGWEIHEDKFTGGKMEIRKDGTIESTDFASNVAGSGFRLTANQGGFLEVENARIRGTLSTAVFEKETVNAVGGQLYVANSTVLTGSATNPGGAHSSTQTTMSVENVSGFSQGEILSIKKVGSTGFSTEYVLVNSSSRFNASSETDFSGDLFVQRGLGAGTTGDSGSLGESPVAAQSYSGSQVVVSTGKQNTGYIRLNANPNDITTPYMDIVERTGSGIYDVQLKARLGDLSGLSSARLHGTNPNSAGFGLFSENVFLQGGIVANTGSIAGVKMEDNQLFIGTGEYTSSNTPFYVSGKSDATAGDFSLGDKLQFDASTGRLTISGEINITDGPLAGVTTSSLADSTGSAGLPAGIVSSSAQLAADISGSLPGGIVSSSAQLAADISGSLPGGVVSGSAQLAADISGSTSALSSSITDTIMTDATGKLVKTPSTSGLTGLVQNSKRMGFINGGTFTSFISSSGAFIFQGADSNNLISFDGVSGNLVIKSNETVLSGSSVSVLAEKFFLGGSSQFVSGSNGNIEVSSSKFHLQPDGDVVTNDITASNAFISGSDVNIQTSTLDLNTTNLRIETTTPSMRIGPASGASRITMVGAPSASLVFTSGSSETDVIKITQNENFSLKTDSGGFEVLSGPMIEVSNGGIIKAQGSAPFVTLEPKVFGFTGEKAFFQGSRDGAITLIRNAMDSGDPIGLRVQSAASSTATSATGIRIDASGGSSSVTGLDIFQLVGTQIGRAIETETRVASDGTTGGDVIGIKSLIRRAGTGGEGGLPQAFTATGSAIQGEGGKYAIHGKGAGTYAGYFEGDTLATGTISGSLIRSTGDVVAFYSSDKQLKDNISYILNPIEKVKKISGYEFDWNNKQDVYTGHDVGVIAQEIEKVIPEIVAINNNGYKAVKYEKIIPLLIESIKEQQKQIEELKKKIEDK